MKRARMLAASGIGMAIAAPLTASVVGWRRFGRQIDREMEQLSNSNRDTRETVTEEMLANLPAPVQRYLTHTGVVGKPQVQSVYLEQVGTMHPDPDGPWIPLRARQFYTVQPAGFVWDGSLCAGPVPIVRGRDRYDNGHGHMLIKIGSVIPVVNLTGPEIDQGAMMRYLSEMIWFPAAFLRDNISFEPIDDNSAKVTLTDSGASVSATMFFDDKGRLITLNAQRYRAVGKEFEMGSWETPVIAYGEHEGLRLPVHGQAIWKLPGGDYTYIDVTITRVVYNVTPP